MEGPIKITLLYNNKKIKLQLPSTYNEFLKLLEDKLYLTPELVNSAIIYYQDSDGDNNILSEDSYNQSLEDNNGIFEMSLDLKNKKDDSDDDNNNNNQVNAKLGKNEIKNIEKKIAVKFSKIFEEKLKKKDLEYQKEI